MDILRQKMVKAKKISTTRSSASRLLLALGMIVLINVLSQQLFFRLDLTKEKRYTLSASSERLASKLNDVLYIKVYLEGEFPAGFKRLRNSTRELLDEYRIVSGGKIEYEFIDPFEGKTTEQINEIVQQLGEKGLYPTNVQIKQDDEMSQKLIVPGATFAYKGKEYPLNLLKNQFGADPEQTINQSLELLEYQISNVLRKCTIEEKKKIAFLTGNGELQGKEVADFARELAEYYELGRINLHDFPVEKLTEFDGMIIAKPDSFFTEYDKFKIDQYIMHGGKVIWLIDALFANMDSTRNSAGEFMTYNYDLNLDDMLFRYGVRINPVLVQDLQSNYIPILNNFPGAPAQTKMLPWLFYPVMGSSSNHPIVKNLDYVWGQFTNTLDTVGARQLNKTVLLHTSLYSRTVSNPARVNINMARLNPNPELFNRANMPVAVLLEGGFESVFKYRYKGGNDSSLKALQYKEKTDSNSMIVIADGDIIRNQVSKEGQVYPLGFDKYSKQTFGNKNFMVNCVDYLCDESGLIEVRMKEIKLRLLDRAKLKSEKLKWQLINMVIPVLLLVLFGGWHAWWRKRKYTS